MSKKVMVKISKDGVSRTIGSVYGFGSWTIGATSFELEVELDLTTDEGREALKETERKLGELCRKALDRDIDMMKQHSPEFKESVEKRELTVQKSLEQSASVVTGGPRGGY